MDTAVAKASVLTEALPYIQDFRGSVVLVKLGGSVMEVESNLESLMDDVAFMRAVGMKVVIVHGGGKAISKAIKESGHEPKFVEGLRVTDEQTMEIVRRTLNNIVNPDLVRRLQARGANARPLHGNWLFAARRITEPDRGYVGEVVKADARAVGMKVVMVHGGGKAISKAIKESGHEPKFVDGLRVTDEETMEIVRRTLNNVVNPDLIRRLQSRGANARPLHGNWIFAARRIAKPDRGYVGEVVNADTRAVCEMLAAGIIPVVTPLGTGVDDGHLYNINADFAGAALSKALKVRKFALVSDVPGLLKDPADPSTLFSTLHLGDVETLKADGVISGGMLPKIESCADAIRAGVKKVHLVDGRMAHSLLLEIFTREGVGTEITE